MQLFPDVERQRQLIALAQRLRGDQGVVDPVDSHGQPQRHACGVRGLAPGATVERRSRSKRRLHRRGTEDRLASQCSDGDGMTAAASARVNRRRGTQRHILRSAIGHHLEGERTTAQRRLRLEPDAAGFARKQHRSDRSFRGGLLRGHALMQAQRADLQVHVAGIADLSHHVAVGLATKLPALVAVHHGGRHVDRNPQRHQDAHIAVDCLRPPSCGDGTSRSTSR